MRNFDWLLILFVGECWAVLNCMAKFESHYNKDWQDLLYLIIGVTCFGGVVLTILYMIVAI